MLGNDPKKNVDKDPFGFTGGLDARNGKWKLGARFYDSSKSAFMQQDRYLGDASDPLSLNRYSYCGLDPVNFVDPTGFNAQAVAEFAGGTIITISMLTGAGEVVLGTALIVTGGYLLYKEISSAYASSGNKTGLPSQGEVKGDVPGAPPVDAGKQGKHVPGHPNYVPGKSSWPEGETGVHETQEAWQKGDVVKPDGTVKVYNNGSQKIKVHQDTKGRLHGYPI